MFARSQPEAFAALPVALSHTAGTLTQMTQTAPAKLTADNDRYAGGVVTLLVRRRKRMARRENH